MGGTDYKELSKWKLFMPELTKEFASIDRYIDLLYMRCPTDITLYLYLKSMQLSERYENRSIPDSEELS